MSGFIYQLLPSIRGGDAVSNDAMRMDALLRQNGYRTQLYADRIGGGLEPGLVRAAGQMPNPEPDDLLLYHLSIGSPLHRRIAQFACRKIFVYHNITPYRFFAGFDSDTEVSCREGLREIGELRDVPDLVLADSGFNRDHLRTLGYHCEIEVLPILFPAGDYAKEPNPEMLARLRDGRYNILFTGRISPNKKQEDLLAAFAEYHKEYNACSRLILAGYDGMKRYSRALKEYRDRLGLTAEDVFFTGSISFAQILACYRAADVFLCLSEHEGFCVPLLEAMTFDLPIIAYDAGAVAETLGGSGILLRDKSPARVAAVIETLRRDGELAREVAADQRERMAKYDEERTAVRFLAVIETFMGKGEGGYDAGSRD